jgi:hypothetical protein
MAYAQALAGKGHGQHRRHDLLAGNHLSGGSDRGDDLMAKDESDPLRDVHVALLRVIAELRALGIAPPISLHQAMHALTYAKVKRAEKPDE